MSHPRPHRIYDKASQWEDVLPAEIAVLQRKWEWGQQAHRMRQMGWPYCRIGAFLGVSRERVRQREAFYLRRINAGKRAPIEVYLSQRTFV